ncbi:hypothetical protein [Mucilaginibacter rubeus]|uniref:Right-handed parallel beta-helix repeat-containing protein n=1 Tax=Mucilaginibacter rubeus TaxID=2027860 RepID=A0A5C1HV29_9SPHI|nr:hypothetical protein [Mucilaginibacter rubeus]QEM09654.1 hypothetical protein DEO27_006330 [Mucilaginibacter rubeus]
MKKYIIPVICILMAATFSGCQKWKGEHMDIYSYTPPAANPVSDKAPLSCSSSGSTVIPVKGTMLSGKTYSVEDGCDLVINPTDTLLMQPGVTLNMGAGSSLIALGTLVSNGSKDQPNWITVPGIVKNDAPGGLTAAADPAYAGKWKGIIGGPTCKLLVLRWTHVEYAGLTEGKATSTIAGSGTGNQYSILFANYNGNFIMEDSWLYGGVDDPIRISAGKIAIFRNTFEKNGVSGGDCLNAKGGTVGTMAYNMFIGTATNGQKASNKGQATGAPQTNIVMYNNTFVSGGYRQVQSGRGGCINFEEGAAGMYYNNVAINCRFGYRVVGSPVADVAHLSYGNNYQWADSLSVANQFYPTGYITQPQSTDIPSITTSAKYLPSNYTLGSIYDGSDVVQKNNPMFLNFPLPTVGHPLYQYSAIGNFNFHLLASSPLIGKGNTTIKPLITVPLDKIYGLSDATLPGTDLGAYQLNGSGNQH